MSLAQGNCPDVDADAGPDKITCDPTMPVMLEGQTNAPEFFWTPPTYLSNPLDLNTKVNAPPGKYKYVLHTKGLSSTNLIFNGDFELGYTGFTTGYTRGMPGGPFGPSNIDVGPDPFAYNAGFSHCTDHGGGGNQLVVDGHTAAGTPVWCQTVPTVAGKTYQFSFFVQSVFPVSPPNLSIRVNGNSFGNVSSGAVCVWVPFMACFTATSSSSTICIVENTGVGFGNDFALDDIEMYEKCEDMDEVIVEVIDLKAVLRAPIVPDCSSEPFDLEAQGSSFGPNIKIEWSNNGGKIISKNGYTAVAKGSGTYTVKIIYDNGNVHCEKEAEIVIDIPGDLLGSVTVDREANCKLDSVTILANIFDGSGKFRYTWTPANLILSGQGTDKVKVLSPGKYSVVVTDLTSGCDFEDIVMVMGDTTGPQGLITGDTLLTCKNNSVRLSSSPFDTAKYSFNWILPDLTIKNDQANIVSTLSGKYKMIIIDRKTLCTDTSEYTINENKIIPTFTLGADQIIDCKTTTIDINATQNMPGSFSYNWFLPPAIFQKDSSLQTKKISQAGTIILKVINNINGCESADTINVNDIRKIPSVDAGSNQTLNCKNNSVILSGTSNLQNNAKYIWKNQSGIQVNTANSNQVNITQPGTYFYTVIDSTNFCEKTDSVIINLDTKKPKAIIEPDKTFKCADSLVIIDGSASDQGIRILYQWLTANGNIISGSNTNKITINNAGTYFLTVIDTANGCTDTAKIIVSPDQNKPILTASVNDTLDCITKEVVLTATAKTNSGAALNYTWSSAQNNFISDPSALNPKVNQAGTYIFFAKDQLNGCSASAQVTVSIDTASPIANAGIDQTWDCITKQLQCDATSSIGTKLKYEWTTINGIINSNPNTSNIQVGKPGSYFVKITNGSNGCTATDQVDIKPDLNLPQISIQPPLLLTCVVKQIDLSALGSNTGNTYKHLWSTKDGIINGNVDQLTTTITKIGTYYFTTINTLNNCTNIDSIVVNEDIKKPIVDAGSDKTIGCSISSTKLESNTANTNTIIWSTSDGNIIGSINTPTIEVDKEGTYQIMVTDPNNGCTASDIVVVNKITDAPIGIVQQIYHPLCPEDFGKVEIENTIGGTAPFEYYLDGKKISKLEIDNLSPGTYTLKVVDKNGCEFTKKFTIDPAIGVSVKIMPQVELYAGDNYKLLPNYSIPVDSIQWFKWTPSANLSCSDCPYPTLIAGTDDQHYTVVFASDDGCEATTSILVKILKRNIWVPNIISPNHDQLNDNFFPVVSVGAYKQINYLSIYNRWGEKLFHQEKFQANDPKQGWDGTYRSNDCLPGVYVYVLELEWNNGEKQILSGDLTLIK